MHASWARRGRTALLAASAVLTVLFLIRQAREFTPHNYFDLRVYRAAVDAWLDDNECSFILCDIRMPDMDGPALWRALQTQHPHMLGHLAFITGDTLSARFAQEGRDAGRHARASRGPRAAPWRHRRLGE